jgi:hypothetical protein
MRYTPRILPLDICADGKKWRDHVFPANRRGIEQ